MILLRVSNTTLSERFFGYWFSIYFSDFFPNAWSKLSHVEVLLKTLWTVPSITFILYCKRAQPLKFRLVPVSVGFWYHPHVTFFSESTLTFKPKKAKLTLLSSSSMVNCKFGCNLLAASRTNPRSPLTDLTMTSTYLRKTLTPFTARSASCCFLQAIQYQTVSAMSAYSDSDMLLQPKWYQFKQASHSTPFVDYVTFFWHPGQTSLLPSIRTVNFSTSFFSAGSYSLASITAREALIAKPSLCT